MQQRQLRAKWLLCSTRFFGSWAHWNWVGDSCAACVSSSFQHSTSNEEEYLSLESLILILKYRLKKLNFWITLYIPGRFKPRENEGWTVATEQEGVLFWEPIWTNVENRQSLAPVGIFTAIRIHLWTSFIGHENWKTRSIADLLMVTCLLQYAFHLHFLKRTFTSWPWTQTYGRPLKIV